MIPQAELNNYKLQVELLQEKLKRSEDNRQQLENKLDYILKKKTECEKATKSQNRQKYQKFLEEQRERNERNKKLVSMLERIDQQATALSSRSERLKLMKLQYELYFAKLLQSQNPLCAADTNQKIATPLLSSSMLQLSQATSKSNNFQPIPIDSQLLSYNSRVTQMEDMPYTAIPNHIKKQQVTDILTSLGETQYQQQQQQQQQQTPIICKENWSMITPTGMLLNNNPSNISNATLINRDSGGNFDYRYTPIGYQINDQQQHVNFDHKQLYHQQIYPVGQVNLKSHFQNSMPTLSPIDGRTGQLMMNELYQDVGRTNDSVEFQEYKKSISPRSSLMPPWQDNQNLSLSSGKFLSKSSKSTKDNNSSHKAEAGTRDENEDRDDYDDNDDDDDDDEDEDGGSITRNVKNKYKNYHTKNTEEFKSGLMPSSSKLANIKTNNFVKVSDGIRPGNKFANIDDDINVTDNTKITDVNNKIEKEKSQPINIVQRDTKFILKENQQRQIIDENGNNAKRQNSMPSETMIGDLDDDSNGGVGDIADQVTEMSFKSSVELDSNVNGSVDIVGKKLKIPQTISSLNQSLKEECHQTYPSHNNNRIETQSELRKPALFQQLSSVDPVMWNFNGRIDPTPTEKSSNDTLIPTAMSNVPISENSNNNYQPLQYQPSTIHFGPKEKLSIEKIENAIYGELINPKKPLRNESLDDSTIRKDVTDSEFITTPSNDNDIKNSVREEVDNELKTESGSNSIPSIDNKSTLPELEVKTSNLEEMYTYPASQNYENYDNYNQNENISSQSLIPAPNLYEENEIKTEQTSDEAFLETENYSEEHPESYVAPTHDLEPSVDYSAQQYDQTQDYQYPAEQGFTEDQNYSNTDYQNYENSGYPNEYDPNTGYAYNYDQQNAAYADPNQQYSEGYDQQMYSDQTLEQNYAGEYTGYETQQQEPTNPPADMNELISENAYQQESELQLPFSNETLINNIEITNEEESVVSDVRSNASSAAIKPILTTEKESTNKKKKRVNFVDSETEESSSAATKPPSDPAASNESDFEFSAN